MCSVKYYTAVHQLEAGRSQRSSPEGAYLPLKPSLAIMEGHVNMNECRFVLKLTHTKCMHLYKCQRFRSLKHVIGSLRFVPA